MATDIHSYIEFRESKQSPWRCAREIISWVGEYGYAHHDVPRDYQPWGHIRSSTLFCLLHGLAPRRWRLNYETFDTIVDEVRGLPDDLSPELRAIYEADASDIFAPGYVTLAEIELFDWTSTFEAEKLDGHDGVERLQIAYNDWGAQFLDLVAELRKFGGSSNARMIYWFDC